MTARANLSIGPGAVGPGVDTHEALRLACLAQEAGMDDRRPEAEADLSSPTGEATQRLGTKSPAAAPHREGASQ
jgi:hypothetical protein